jgi:hypothetical protein
MEITKGFSPQFLLKNNHGSIVLWSIILFFVLMGYPLSVRAQDTTSPQGGASAKINSSSEPVLSVGVSPASLMSFVAPFSENGVPLDRVWLSLAVSVGIDAKEYSLGFAKYPHYVSLMGEQRFFFSSDFSGFFYGPFVSLDMLTLTLDDSRLPAYTVSAYEKEQYHVVGLRVGGALGWRFRFSSVAITPRLGLAVPLLYLWGLENTTSDAWWTIYGATALARSVSLGCKIDFFSK